MAPNVDGIWYYVSAAFSLAALLSASTSNPKILSKVCLTRFPVFLIPETKGWVSFFTHALLDTADDVVQTLEEMDPVFRDNATDSLREHKEGIRRELGLPDQALLNAQ
jgi:hypothetical protein